MINKLVEAINYNYYADKITEKKFNELVELDPTSDKKYARWIVEVYLRSYGAWESKIESLLNKKAEIRQARSSMSNEEFFSKYQNIYQELAFEEEQLRRQPLGQEIKRFWAEDSYKITDDLMTYTKLKNKKLLPNERDYNIMNFKSYNALWEVIDSISDEVKDSANPLGKDEYEKWYEDDKWLVVIPKTHRAACKYGAHTKWCTASREDDSYFNRYHSEETPLIDIIDKVGGRKWQLHFAENQWMDAKDDPIGNRTKFIEDTLSPEVRKAIYEHTKNFMFAEDKTEIIWALAHNNSQFIKLKNALYLEDFAVTATDNGIKYLSDVLNGTLAKYAYWEIIDKYADYPEAYSQGYNAPWKYLEDEEPEDPDELVDDEVRKLSYWKQDIDYWSAEQRERAGQEVEQRYREYDLEDSWKEFNYDWDSNRHTLSRADEVYDKVIKEYLDMGPHPEETIDTIIKLSTLFPDAIYKALS